MPTDRIEKHLRVLCEEIGERHLGSDGERMAVEYLAGEFEASGYEVALEKFDAPGWRYGKFSFGVQGSSWTFPCFPCFYSNACDVSGPLLRLGKDEVERLEGIDVRDRLCFIDLPTSVGAVMGRNDLAERLDRMGAAAMIVISNYPDTVNTKIVRSPDLKQLAVIVVSIDTARELAALGALPCVLKIEAENFQTRASNVVGRSARRGARKVAVCAHYDTAPGISGACDNASGVAVMLECARLLAKNPGGRQLEFIAFGGEEFGQRNGRPIGSDSYIDRHQDELHNIVCLLDIDTVGTTCCDMALRFHGSETLRDTINTTLRHRNTRVQEARPDGDGSAFFSASVPTLCFRNPAYERIRIHSPHDNLDLIDLHKLSETCAIACDVLAGI